MNYLAHAYLSFNNPEILIGNMISDFVKGKAKFTYSPGIQNGIALHRAIDQFTDDHPATRAASQFFRPAYRLYSGAFIDVIYDHFLATDPNEFMVSADLEKFSETVYQTLKGHLSQLPPVFQKMVPHMAAQNWLSSYQYKWGVEKGFWGMVSRAAYLTEYDVAFSIFNEHYEELKDCYRQFFPAQKQYAAVLLNKLVSGKSIHN